MLEHSAESIVHDLVRYLSDAAAVTITKSEQQIDKNYTDYDVFLPVLMPLDTKERWNGDPLETEKRIMEEYDKRVETGKPYIFKICEVKED